MRADIYLVQNGYYESRARAQAAIKAGLVFVDGKRVKKSSDKVTQDVVISASDEHPWVSRGGLKLVHALSEFDINPSGKTCLDVGASTGGFSDVLITHGALKVYAVDVGHSQLHAKLKLNPDIISMESRDARGLIASDFSSPPELIVCDASFISAMKVLETPLKLAAPKAWLITLIKPQFEVGKSGIGRGGLVKSADLSKQALKHVSIWVASQGWSVKGTCDSPIKGGSGNHEYLLLSLIHISEPTRPY